MRLRIAWTPLGASECAASYSHRRPTSAPVVDFLASYTMFSQLELNAKRRSLSQGFA